MPEKLIASGTFEPVSTYYQFGNLPAEAGPKAKKLEKGKSFIGEFQITLVKTKETSQGTFTFTSHLIKTISEGTVSLPGCVVLNGALQSLKRGDFVAIIYQGTGKAKAGKKAPKLFDAAKLTAEEFEAEKSKLGISSASTKKAVSKAPPIEEVEEEADADDEELAF
jgi:hypothetical protein